MLFWKYQIHFYTTCYTHCVWQFKEKASLASCSFCILIQIIIKISFTPETGSKTMWCNHIPSEECMWGGGEGTIVVHYTFSTSMFFSPHLNSHCFLSQKPSSKLHRSESGKINYHLLISIVLWAKRLKWKAREINLKY